MYNPQLKTFLIVAETGSFNRAAEQLYISASAVSQQINHLERDLSVTLFHRTNRGLQLTKAGEYLVEESRAMMEHSDAVRTKLLELNSMRPVIKVGTSLEEQSRLLYDLWLLFKSGNTKYDVQLVFIENSSDFVRRCDMVESICDGISWQDGWKFLELFQVQWTIAVGKSHPLYDKTKVSIEDLQKYGVIVIDRAVELGNSAICRRLDENQIEYEIKPNWSGELIWKATVQNDLVLIPSCWADVFLNMRIIPCELTETLPYGFFYRDDTGKPAMEFIDFISKLYIDGSPEDMLPIL